MNLSDQPSDPPEPASLKAFRKELQSIHQSEQGSLAVSIGIIITSLRLGFTLYLATDSHHFLTSAFVLTLMIVSSQMLLSWIRNQSERSRYHTSWEKALERIPL